MWIYLNFLKTLFTSEFLQGKKGVWYVKMCLRSSNFGRVNYSETMSELETLKNKAIWPSSFPDSRF